ncbi:MAG: TrkA family potassium uptake protein, partial [Flavobacteriales bacterium]
MSISNESKFKQQKKALRLFRYRFLSKLIFGFALIISVTTIGTLGFMYLEGFRFVDAFYMTIITVSTVGFKEVSNLSDTGMFFTSFLIILSLGSFAYGISLITSFIFEREYKKDYKTYKLYQKLSKLRDHTIVCGFGRVGKRVTDDLDLHNLEYVIIESDSSIFEDSAYSDHLHIIGDATKDNSLIEAGIENAKALITCLPSDPNNLYVVLSARSLNKKLNIVCRATEKNSVKKLEEAGAHHVVLPD